MNESILTNYLRNALKFTDNGFIEFGLNDNGTSFTFYVKDSVKGEGSTFYLTIRREAVLKSNPSP